MMLIVLMMKRIRDNMLFMSASQKQILALGTDSERERVLKIVQSVHRNKTHSLGAKCDWCFVEKKIRRVQ